MASRPSTTSLNKPTASFKSYVLSLPKPQLESLYSSPSARGASLPRGCFFALTVVMTLLNQFERTLVLRMSTLEPGRGVPRSQFDSWFKSGVRYWQWDKLRELHVIQVNHDYAKDTTGKAWFIRLRKAFHESLRRSLASEQKRPWELLPTELLKPCPVPPPTLQDLNMYTQGVWNGILHFLVGERTSSPPPDSVLKFISDTGLMVPQQGQELKKDPKMVISSKGYDFMLKDVSLQVWSFVIAYLGTLAEGLATEALLLLSELAHCKVGEGYPVALLTKLSQTLMPRFKDFGLIYFVKGSKLFYPTAIAIGLIEGSIKASTSKLSSETVRGAEESKAIEEALALPDPSLSPHIAIIVQTNFSVAAYTCSSLHIHMLNLFCDPESMQVLPNLVLCSLTRDSVKAAFAQGIKARQILRFLKMHAHPRVLEMDDIVPPNVEDQIWLWEKELSRVNATPCYKIQCSDRECLDEVERYAKKLNGHLFKSEKNLINYVEFKVAEAVNGYRLRYERSQALKSAQMQIDT
mmetsp:Transcript_10171/g.20243  ORF Transcript_10171/g.20243 Transcript_10171/m.20243 type:complete len:521 (-) Transcript_10171:26-1588(-)